MSFAFRSSIAVVSTGPKYTFVATTYRESPFNPIAEMKGLEKAFSETPSSIRKKSEKNLFNTNQRKLWRFIQELIVGL